MKEKIEDYNMKITEIDELKVRNAELIEEGVNLASVKLEEERALIEKYEKLLGEKEEILGAKHRAEIDSMSTKLKEEMKSDLPALEEKLRVEYEQKMRELEADLESAMADLERVIVEKEVAHENFSVKEALISELETVKEELTTLNGELNEKNQNILEKVMNFETEKKELMGEKVKFQSDFESAFKTKIELEAIVEDLNKKFEQNVNVINGTELLRDELDSVNKKLLDSTKQIEELEKQVERLKYDVSEAERLRDIVDAECDKLESELEETKVKLVEMNTSQEHYMTALSQFQDGGRRSFEPSSLQSTMVAGQQTMLNNVSMDCTLIPAPDVGRKLMELEKVNEELQAELNDVKRQLASSPTEEKYLHLKSQLIQQKEYNDKIFEDNQTLKNKLKKFEESAATDNTSALQKKLADVKEELGRKNIAYASLKVDVEKGELEYKRKCEILQSDLDYEKAVVARLTQDARRLQANAMETTVVAPRAAVAATNTSAQQDSPVWSSGSGAIKEI